MKSRCALYFPLLFSLAMLFPFQIFCKGLSINPGSNLRPASPDGDFITVPRDLAIPLAIHTVCDSSLRPGMLKFFRVTEDVAIGAVCLFGAGAIACGRIQNIEKDAQGCCLSVDIELVNVQATDGSRVVLATTRVKIKTPAANTEGTRIRIDAEIRALIQGEVQLRV